MTKEVNHRWQLTNDMKPNGPLRPRFGGRCSVEEKQLLARLSEAEGISEKDLIFKALKYFEENS